MPIELPLEHLDLPAPGGHIGPAEEDFEVDEIPLYEPSGEGDHTYVRVRKRGATTASLVAAVARVTGARERDIGCAGLKDKHAVTTQWLSVPAGQGPPPSEWSLPGAFELLEVSRHTNKLRTGHLLGNRFTIRIVGVAPGALGRARALVERLAKVGLGNYFGRQRFGVGQTNLQVAVEALRRRRLGKSGGNRAKFLASVIQSELFNRFAVARLARGAERLLPGEVVRLRGSRTVFVVEDPELEQPRLLSGDIHLTGPMRGPKMKEPQGEAARLEEAQVDSLGVDREGWASLARLAPGTRRDLLVRPEPLSVEPDGPEALVLSFALPSGSYAGQVVRVFTRGGPWLPAPRFGDPPAPAPAIAPG